MSKKVINMADKQKIEEVNSIDNKQMTLVELCRLMDEKDKIDGRVQELEQALKNAQDVTLAINTAIQQTVVMANILKLDIKEEDIANHRNSSKGQEEGK